ncbi:SapC family protein [Rheinheimera sp.]|uniref:SapC family protein n=1 Tax=Rheinheimera sp. TaxID=1869214 RepID=UPI003D270F08
MTQPVLLNAADHADVRVITARGAEYGDNQWFATTFPLEMRSCAACYPLFFFKDTQSQQIYPVALFGFQHGENLFLQSGWQEQYLPLSVRRQPFLIGRQQVREDGMVREQRVLHIDLDHPRVCRGDNPGAAEPLFLPYGGQTPFLQDMAGLLETLHLGMQDANNFVALLEQYQLLEPITVNVTLKDGSSHQLVGFLTIAEEQLAKLDGAALAQLHQHGYLQAIYLMIASQAQIRQLVTLKNQQLGL